MARQVSIGTQDYASLIENDWFYVDKTLFIKNWWDNADAVTLITRPRRFGKTLTMSMCDYFFSNKYAGRSDLFEELDIWKEEKFRKLQGTYPVIFMTFAGVKGKNYEDMDDIRAELSLQLLSTLLQKYYGKKVLIFLDEYDTPLQEAYVQGYWDEMTSFIRTMFNNTFEVKKMFEKMIRDWFKKDSSFNSFVKAMFSANLRDMNTVKSNRESGYGRYDVVLEPKNKNDVAVIIEFKVYDKEYDNENDLKDTAANALAQIEEKQYAAELMSQGIPENRILKYGFAFQGKKCYIAKG